MGKLNFRIQVEDEDTDEIVFNNATTLPEIAEQYLGDAERLVKRINEARQEKVFMFYLKSHTDAPDFELEIKAKDRKEALDILKTRRELSEFPEDILDANLDELPK